PELEAGSQYRRQQASPDRFRVRRREQGAAALGARVCRLDMNARTFGPKLTADGAQFRLWAPTARRVGLLLEKPRPMTRREDAWYFAELPGVHAGAHYKFRIDDEID